MPGDQVESGQAPESRDHEAYQRIQRFVADGRWESMWVIEETAAGSGQLEPQG